MRGWKMFFVQNKEIKNRPEDRDGKWRFLVVKSYSVNIWKLHMWTNFIWKERERRLMLSLSSIGRNATQQRSQHPLKEKAVHAWLWRSFLLLFNYWRSQLHNNSRPLSFCRHNEHSCSVTSCWGAQTRIPCLLKYFLGFLSLFSSFLKCWPTKCVVFLLEENVYSFVNKL